MISKLLLVRCKQVTSDLVSKTGLSLVVVGAPISISPCTWAEEAGLSHYGFILNMTLKQWQEIKPSLEAQDGFTLLDWDDKQSGDTVLKSVGLRVHPSAE